MEEIGLWRCRAGALLWRNGERGMASDGAAKKLRHGRCCAAKHEALLRSGFNLATLEALKAAVSSESSLRGTRF